MISVFLPNLSSMFLQSCSNITCPTLYCHMPCEFGCLNYFQPQRPGPISQCWPFLSLILRLSCVHMNGIVMRSWGTMRAFNVTQPGPARMPLHRLLLLLILVLNISLRKTQQLQLQLRWLSLNKMFCDVLPCFVLLFMTEFWPPQRNRQNQY